MIDDPTRIKGLPEDAEVSGLFDDEAIKTALLANDETAAADLIYKSGARTVILQHGVAPSTDVGARA